MNEQPKKKRHSLWWIWLILILTAFAGGIVLGLKLNTLPLPNEVQGKLYPILESYIPGSTKTREAQSETPVETETPKPEETAEPAETEAPALIEAPTPEEVEAPAAAETLVEPLAPTPEETEAPAVIEAPAETEAPTLPVAPAPIETQLPEEAEGSKPEMTETAVFTSEPPTVKYIGVNKALELALQDADTGDKKAEVSGVYRTKDDDGNPVYEVSFTIDETGYDYVIDAVSGEIMSWRLSGLSFSETAAFGNVAETEPAELAK